MPCGCEHNPTTPCRRCANKPSPRKGVVKFCDICDPCAPPDNNVKLCAFVVPTLEEGRYYRDSFVFVQEDDSVYYIDDHRSEIPFGSRPKFIEDFDPTQESVRYKSTVVYDVKNGVAYVYDPEGKMATVALTSSPITGITAGDGIVITGGSNKTIAVDDTVAKAKDLQNTTYLVTNHTHEINTLKEQVGGLGADVNDLDEKYTNTHDIADSAHELAVEARNEAGRAQQGATEALSEIAKKQNKLLAGENITIEGDTISAFNSTYNNFVGTDGEESGLAGLVPAPTTKDTDKYLSSDGKWERIDVSTAVAQAVSDLVEITNRDPGAGTPLAEGHFIAVYGG